MGTSLRAPLFKVNMNWILAHLIGDYILQTDWMALGKKKRWHVCLIHVATYLVPFLLCGFEWWQILAIGFQHYIQDRSSFVLWFMEIKGSSNFAKAPMAPWSIIVTDNIIHILWISFIVWIGNYVN